MPKRKTLPKNTNYEGLGNSDKSKIQKSRPLQSLSETDLTLPEFKILDAYLSRINSHDEEKRTVKLEKGELERALGVSRILKDDLNKRLRHLFQVIEIRDDTKRNGFKLINLFEEAEAEQDDNGLWQINLTCTPSAREYIFNIDNIGYLQYRLKNVINLTSRYSYILFLYLLDNRFRKTWIIQLSELKKLLNCTADTYSQYKRFNDLVLKKCQKEINEKTDIKFEYIPIKQGRKVNKIKFTVETLSDIIQLEDDKQLLSLPPKEKEFEVEYGGELANLLGSSACENEFSVEEIRIIQDLVLQAVKSSNHIELCDYLIGKVHKMNLYDSKTEINNRFAYLCKMIEEDI